MITRSIIKQMENKVNITETLLEHLDSKLRSPFWKCICDYSKDLHSFKILFLTIFVEELVQAKVGDRSAWKKISVFCAQFTQQTIPK